MSEEPVRVTTVPKPRALRSTALVLVLALAFALRAPVLVRSPDFYGPGDPSIYFTMAKGWLTEGSPSVDFVWHYLTRPQRIRHLEDYYEPAYALLLAAPMSVLGSRTEVARSVALAAGMLVLVLLYVRARRFGVAPALIAMALVAIDPWSILYSGQIMKETVAALIVVSALWAIARRIEAWSGARAIRGLGAAFRSAAAWRSASALAGLAIVAGLFQYELIPILGTACAIALFVHARAVLPAFLVVFAAGCGVLAAVTLATIGVPISAKLEFFFAHNLWSPIAEPRAFAFDSLRTFLPLRTMFGHLFTAWNPAIGALAVVGMLDRRLPRAEASLLAGFALGFLYFHGVPLDLWARDFIPLTAALAPAAALALTGPLLTGREPGAGPEALAGTARGMLRRFALPAIAAIAIFTLNWRTMPYPRVYANGEFPNYPAGRAARREFGAWFAAGYEPAPTLTSHPAEIVLDAGFPGVALPEPPLPAALREAARLCGVRYMVVADWQVDSLAARAAGFERLAAHNVFTLYEATALARTPGAPSTSGTRRTSSPESAR